MQLTLGLRARRTLILLSAVLTLIATVTTASVTPDAAPVTAPVTAPEPGSGPSAAAVRTATHIDVTEAGGVVYVDWGDRRPLTGQRLRIDSWFGPATQGQRVRLQKRSAGGWRTVATESARLVGGRQAGRAVFRARVRSTGSWRVLVLPGRNGEALLSAPQRVRAVPQRPDVTARWSDGRVRPGERLLVRGRTAPEVGRLVVLQRRLGDRWKPVARTRPGTEGRYRLATVASERGRHSYRLKAVGNAPETGGRPPVGTSAVKTIRVAPRWRPGPLPDGSAPAPEDHEPAPADEPQTPPAEQPAPAEQQPAAPAAEPAAAGDPSDWGYLSDNEARWNPCQVITYRVNANRAPRGALADTHAAVAAVEEVSGLDFEYLGRTDVVPQKVGREGYPDDTDLVVAWTDHTETPMLPDNPGTAGVGGFTSVSGKRDEAGNAVWMSTAGTIVLNTQTSWLEPGFGEGKTVGELLMHEVGHVVGLSHARDTSQILYPKMQSTPAVWGAGDRSGLRAVGRASGCLYNRDGSNAEPTPSASGGAVEVSR